MKNKILEVHHLKKYFPVKTSRFHRKQMYIKALDDVSLFVTEGETLSIVGESGCGKSTLGRTVIRLYQPTAGQIYLNRKDITHFKERQLRPVRQEMQMVFQDPYASLNPKKTIGSILEETYKVNKLYAKAERKEKVEELLEKVGLQAEQQNKYPHQFSGGQRQRVGIARALALQPKLIIADEAVSALDVSVQAQIINLLKDLQEESQLSYLFISHDLDVVRYISDRVAVMYLGKIMEIAPKESLFTNPYHPYTEALLSSIPKIRLQKEHQGGAIKLKGELPNPSSPPSGCLFQTRCPQAKDMCKQVAPAMQQVSQNHYVACHLHQVGDEAPC